MSVFRSDARAPVGPPWLRHALTYVGRRELIAGQLSEWVLSLFRFTRFPRHLISERTAWCAAFACSVCEESGIRSPRSARARDFLAWGVPLALPLPGAFCVFARGKNADRGHVAIALDHPYAGSVMCVGGNQDNRVSVRSMSLSLLLGVRWPPDQPLPMAAVRL